MIAMSIKNNFPQIARRLEAMREEVGGRALASALNKVMAQGRTAMVKAITDEYAIKARDVRPQLSIQRARAAGGALVAVLEAFGKRRGHRSRNVMIFGAKQVQGRGQKRVRFKTDRGWITRTVLVGGGVSVKIKRSEGRKLIAGAFIGNQGRTVFIRVPGSARKIMPVETIDIPQMFNTRRLNQRVVDLIETKLPAIFAHEAQFFINQFNR
jgi:hypothetical protein